MDAIEALAFVERHGVVLVAARGPVPRLTEAIAGEPIAGSWWGHAQGHRIYAVLQSVTASPDVLVCRAVAGKVTLVHRRLWPALICAADALGHEGLARLDQEHTSRGHHVTHELAFPMWADADVVRRAASIDEEAALAALGEWAPLAARRRREACDKN